jgi:predicted RNA-binding Zn ribbon-like protein
VTGKDLLAGPGRLGAWLSAAGLGKGGGRGGREAIRLRDAVRGAAEALAAGRRAPAAAVSEIDRILAAHRGALRLRRGRGGLTFGFEPRGNGLAAIAEAAARLLAGPDRDLVRRCANPACVLLFLDATRNRRRRWCTMRICGNRMKVAAWRARRRRRR